MGTPARAREDGGSRSQEKRNRRYKLRLRRVRLQGRWQGGRLLRRGPHPRLQPQPHPQDHRGDRRPGREGEEDAEQGKALTSKISILTSFSSFIPAFVHLLLVISPQDDVFPMY